MSKESLKPNSPECIFRETFNSEQSTRDLGGVPTAVSYLNGIGSCVAANSSKIVYPKNLNGTYSIRIRLDSLTQITNAFLVDFRNTSASGTGFIQVAGLSQIAVSNGTPYINGVATSTIPAAPMEIVITGINISCYEIFLNSRYSSTSFETAGYELFEIYEGTLTASQVALMAKNAQNKSPLKVGSIIETELVTNGGFDTDTGWTKNTGWSITGGKAVGVNSTSTAISQSNVLVVGKKYRITYTIVINSGQFNMQAGGAVVGVIRTSSGTYTEEVVANGTTLFLYGWTNFNLTVDNVSVKEIEPTCLICLDALNGAIKDNTFLNTLTPTNVNVIRDGSSYAMNYNSIDSKLDCGSDFIGTKSITVCAWVKGNSIGETAGRVIDNSKCVLYTITNGFVFTRDFASFASTSSSVPLGNYNFVAITSTSTGSSTFYVGTKDTAPVINGSAGQVGGTPTAGTNVIIGNNAGQTRTLDGDVKIIRVFEGIMSVADITQIWSATKYLI